MSYEVVIAEDDPMISLLNRSFVEKDRRFTVIQEFRDGRAALRWFREHTADLLVLDVFMPGLTGPELLRRLRAMERSVDVIMITAANDARTVDSLLKLGVVDYLVKPFTQERLQQALNTFCLHRENLQGSVTQQDLDALFAPQVPAGTLPKGLQEQTMERVRSCLLATGADGCTSDALAAAAGLSAVTVRRYMNYLVEHGEALSRINYDTGGRPSVSYFPPEETKVT